MANDGNPKSYDSGELETAPGEYGVTSGMVAECVDDDALLIRAHHQIGLWEFDTELPSMTAVQNLFHELISAHGSPMLKDRVIAALVEAFDMELGGKRALASTWTEIFKQVASDRAQEARENRGHGDENTPLTAEEKMALRVALWPSICELAEAPDLMKRIVQQVHAMGVVNEVELIQLTYLAATSRVLRNPINLLAKGASSSGKSFTTTKTLELIGPAFVNYLTSSSALYLVYDTRPLSHTVLVIFEANQLQGDDNSVFAMLLRTLISEGRVVHQTTVEDPDSPSGRRVERIVREGPISLIVTTTGELHAENETRMLSFYVSESREQTRGVIASLAARAAGSSTASNDFAVWHDFQSWIGYGPTDAVIPFAAQIAEQIPPSMVRFRRDVDSLFACIKASAILHQAQRKILPDGRVVATVADYVVAYPIFSRVMAQTSGHGVTDSVRAVVDLIAALANPAAARPSSGRFNRAGTSDAGAEVVLSCQQIGTATGIGKTSAQRAVRAAIEQGFLINNETKPGKPFRLVLKQRADEAASALLPNPDSINPEVVTA